MAFSHISVGEERAHMVHNHASERLYARLGVHGTSDPGDLRAYVQLK
ncbi:hypothetical protein [Maribacter sp. 2307ULW6-5]